MLKAVLFDVDGVLIDSFEANLKFDHTLFTGLGFTPPTREEYRQMFHISLRDMLKNIAKPKNEKELDILFEKGKDYLSSYPDNLITIPKGAEETIKELHKKYKLAIVTSRVHGGAFRMAQTKNLQKYFSTEVYFEDTKKHKPDPEPLLLAIKKLAVLASEAVYIGDALTDLQAAHGAGMKIVLYSKDINNEADFQTTNFRSLPQLLSQIN